jgi:hypothetical protein
MNGMIDYKYDDFAYSDDYDSTRVNIEDFH